MLGILLTILKVILIAAGVILGIIILLVAFLLFNGFKYKALGSKEESVDFNADFRWLLGILKGYFRFSDGIMEYAVTLPFGIKLTSYSSREEASFDVNDKNICNDDTVVTDTKKRKNNAKRSDPRVKKKKPSIADKLKQIYMKIKNSVTGIIDKIKLAQRFNDKYNIRSLIQATYRLIVKLLKNLGLKKFEVDGILGLDDPASTGMTIGAICAVSAFLPFRIDIQGNFDEKEITGKLRLNGKTNLFKILFPIAMYVFTKPVWPLARDYWKGDLNEL